MDADASQWATQVGTRRAYGFPAFGDHLTVTPALGLAFSIDSRRYSLLGPLAPYEEQQGQAEPWEISLEDERQEHSDGSSPLDHSLSECPLTICLTGP